MPRKQNQHTYLTTHTLQARVLALDVGAEDAALRVRASAASAGKASNTLVKEGGLRTFLVALTRGTGLRPHEVDREVSVLVLRGRVRFTTPRGDTKATAGTLIAFDRGVRHSARAETDAGILIHTAMA